MVIRELLGYKVWAIAVHHVTGRIKTYDIGMLAFDFRR